MARRQRRKNDEPHENHERWMVSYADFLTLMFAFFVVMYSLSSVNEGKYRVLSNSLLTAFNSSRTATSADSDSIVPPVVVVNMTYPSQQPEDDTEERGNEIRRSHIRMIHSMADEIRRVLEPLRQSGEVTITQGDHGITIEINASALFPSGEATLDAAAVSALSSVARVLSRASFKIIVEGHTDSTPIHTYRFPSNWELSSARASSVVRLFIDSGVSASQLTAAGYSDQRPVADNNTAEGRSRNRRVTITVESLYADSALSQAVADAPQEQVPDTPGQIQPDDPIQAILPPVPTEDNMPVAPPADGATPSLPDNTAGQS